MKNIGYVLYQKGHKPGTLDATWCTLKTGVGSGKATGGPLDGFEGEYHIQYFDENGNPDDEFDLIIQNLGSCYKLSWIRDDETIACIGVGMEVAEGLAVGWRGLSD